MNLTIEKLLLVANEMTVTYIVKNVSSRDKLKSHLKATGTDPLHRIFIDKRVGNSLKGEIIGYRIEAPAFVKKDKNGRVV